MTKEHTLKITILGAGAFGTALASLFANDDKNKHVTLWGRHRQRLDEIANKQRNSAYLGDIALGKIDLVTDELDTALGQSDIAFVAVPAQSIGIMVKQLADKLPKSAPVILCAKGIDRKTGKLPSQLFAEALPDNRLAVLSGPSFASDLAKGLPTAVTLACNDLELAKTLAKQIATPHFRLYASADVKGVELGGALKNVVALAVGACRGMALGASAEAALIARGFAELSRLALALGARSQTLSGLSGLGDLVLTCSSPQSRNFSYGMALGRGEAVKNLKLAEGALTAGIAHKLAVKKSVDCPVIQTVSLLVEDKINPAKAVEGLLRRPLKAELG